ncbi:hypothetical protein ACS0TY_025789 [Phlomoides rotata]
MNLRRRNILNSSQNLKCVLCNEKDELLEDISYLSAKFHIRYGCLYSTGLGFLLFCNQTRAQT